MSLTTISRDLSFLVGIVTLFIAILRPAMMSKKFGVVATEQALSYVVNTGGRDVFMGLVAVTGFIVVFKNGDKRTSMVHLLGAIGVIVVGTGLLLSN